jgi:hypothetical protein
LVFLQAITLPPRESKRLANQLSLPTAVDRKYDDQMTKHSQSFHLHAPELVSLVGKFVHETAITKAITKKLTREKEKLEFEEANGCDVIVNVLGLG